MPRFWRIQIFTAVCLKGCLSFPPSTAQAGLVLLMDTGSRLNIATAFPRLLHWCPTSGSWEFRPPASPGKSSQDHRKSDVLWQEHQPRKRRFSPNLASIPTHLSGPIIHPSKPNSGITSSVYLILPQPKLVPPQSLLHFAHNCHNSYHIVCN